MPKASLRIEGVSSGRITLVLDESDVAVIAQAVAAELQRTHRKTVARVRASRTAGRSRRWWSRFLNQDQIDG